MTYIAIHYMNVRDQPCSCYNFPSIETTCSSTLHELILTYRQRLYIQLNPNYWLPVSPARGNYTFNSFLEHISRHFEKLLQTAIRQLDSHVVIRIHRALLPGYLKTIASHKHR